MFCNKLFLHTGAVRAGEGLEETKRNQLAMRFMGGKVFLCSGVSHIT